MAQSHAPLQVWVHQAPGLMRNLLQLPSSFAEQQAFKQQLQQARQLGVDGIIVPINWRLVAPFVPEQAEQASSWHGYRQLFRLIREQRLKVMADFSFVATGLTDPRSMNLLPDWLWGRLQQALPADMPLDSLKYLDQHGRDSITALSLWARPVTLPYFRQFLGGFARHMSEFAPGVPHIQLGIGPEGEWRYPFLGRYAEGNEVAYLPCYSELALDSLRQAMLELHGSEAAWCSAWQADNLAPASLPRLKQVVERLAGELVAGQRSPALNDFCRWYQGNLVEYGRDMLAMAHSLFHGSWQGVSLGLRLTGALPTMGGLPNGQIAEVIAGLTSCPFSASRQEDGYLQLLNALASGPWRRRLRLMLTGIGARHGEQDPQLLHPWLRAAQKLNIPLLAENRHSLSLDDHPQWERLIQGVLNQPAFRGWAIRDLDALLMDNGLGEARLRQLSRLKHTQGQPSGLKNKVFRVMGPLHLKVANQRYQVAEADWTRFADEVRSLRRLGVTAISTDVWWGQVEGRQPGEFDWRYYERLVTELAAQQMHWVPILAFHQAGGNVNDDFMQTIPLWLWGKLLQNHPELGSVRDLQYVSETGDASMEYISLWADDYVLPYYSRFMQAFRDHFVDSVGLIDEINISLGPAGELRYPSYNAHDWGNYPNRGTLQCYSPLAEQEWQRHLKGKYGNITALNYAFGSKYERFNAVGLPAADELFDNKAYLYSAWAREYLGWYQSALITHGRRVLETALALFAEAPFQSIPIGIKIPGIHWQISDPDTPRVAEITAGLLRPHASLAAHNQREYVQLLDSLIAPEFRSRVVVHFTCLEMENKDYEGYSRAADLVRWFAEAAQEVGVSLMGENALAGALFDERGWQQIATALGREPGFEGITLLRMQHFFAENRTPLHQLQWLINQFQ